MSSTGTFDVIVVGGGAAGVCCAGELVLHGLRPLLIAEGPEVGYHFRSVRFGQNRGTVQALAWQSSWGGGWWVPLARKLDIPLKLRDYQPMESTVVGTGKRVDLPYMATPSAVAEVLSSLGGDPLPDEARSQIAAATRAAFALSPEEVLALDRVRCYEWLQSHGAGPEVAARLSIMFGRPNGLNQSDAVEYLSAACGLWTLRIWYCHEGIGCEIVPDPCDGVWIPMAREIERRGGQVWRGRKVSEVIIEGGRAVGVILKDGTEVRAPAVALSTGNARIAKLLKPTPAEVQATRDFDGPQPQRQLVMFALFDREVMPTVSLSISWPDGRRLGAAVPTHHTNVEPGKQLIHLVATNIGNRPVDEAVRDVEAGLARVIPGYRDAVIEVKTLVHTSEAWLDYVTVAPKLPRRSGSLDGLWYVGQGAAPLAGCWTEAAAGSGVLGARAIAAAH
ncbi:FAD-binding protein [Mycolicibacterium holsaticum]|uniref:FAD-binding protein n=1 Tax=Mycolicibacterium holsaticum TaxID=152142 RepID=UPI00197B0BE3|nr:FAD-binding protein [Mycolicibacterium holsaticum]